MISDVISDFSNGKIYLLKNRTSTIFARDNITFKRDSSPYIRQLRQRLKETVHDTLDNGDND